MGERDMENKVKRFIHIRDLNEDTVFQALDDYFREFGDKGFTVADTIDALNHVCFANVPLPLQLTKRRLALIIQKYPTYSILQGEIKKRVSQVDLAYFDLAF